MTKPLTVSELCALLRDNLEDEFANIHVTGEVSNLTKAASGHYYFSLKDNTSQIHCTCWNRTAQKLRVPIVAGQQVVASGTMTFYHGNGKTQLTVEQLQPVGVGAADLAKRQLIEKLRALGWFDAPKKRLPRMPRRVALVTSATGAAVRDMIQSFAMRWPLCEIIVRHSRVQGETAPEELSAALLELSALHTSGHIVLDAIIIGRGGGSAEDLNAFDSEPVAAAIHASPVPVVSAVGHEIDVTIADLVADARAETPSNAVTLLTPISRAELLETLSALRERFGESLRGKVSNARRRLELIGLRPVFARPLDRIRRGEQRLDDLADRLKAAIRRSLERQTIRMTALAGRLEAMSPLNVLRRGYSVTRRLNGGVVRNPEDVTDGETIRTTLAGGDIFSNVTKLSS